MTERKRKMTDDEIEADVLSKLDDPSAWEAPIYVAPLRTPRPEWVTRGRHLELAAKLQVLSVLHRLGAEANLTLAQPDNVDITVLLSTGRAITIDVKTLSGTKRWNVERVSGRKNHYIAFVAYPRFTEDPAAPPIIQIVPSKELERFLQAQKPATVSVESLAKRLHIDEPWKHLMAETAA
jgi:hypothetical protein